MVVLEEFELDGMCEINGFTVGASRMGVNHWVLFNNQSCIKGRCYLMSSVQTSGVLICVLSFYRLLIAFNGLKPFQL